MFLEEEERSSDESLSFEADEETHRIVLSSYDLVWKRKAKICSLFKMSGHK